MGRTGVTIRTAVLAAPVRVDARVESDVGTRVASHDRSRRVLKELGFAGAGSSATVDGSRSSVIRSKRFDGLGVTPRPRSVGSRVIGCRFSFGIYSVYHTWWHAEAKETIFRR